MIFNRGILYNLCLYLEYELSQYKFITMISIFIVSIYTFSLFNYLIIICFRWDVWSKCLQSEVQLKLESIDMKCRLQSEAFADYDHLQPFSVPLKLSFLHFTTDMIYVIWLQNDYVLISTLLYAQHTLFSCWFKKCIFLYHICHASFKKTLIGTKHLI